MPSPRPIAPATTSRSSTPFIDTLYDSNDDTRLVELARQEKDLKLKQAIVSHLSLMGGKAATDYMMELLK